MSGKTYNSSPTSTTIGVHGGKIDLLNRIFTMLKERGFVIQTDQRILRDFPTLADTHWEGKKDDLLFKSEIYPVGFRFEFYQEINTKNPSGGFYDFDKFERMPYLIRCQYTLTRKYICELLDEVGYTNEAEPEHKYAFDKVMQKIKSSCHYKEGKELPEYEVDSYNAKDKDGKQLRNGQVKYFRDHKGRLQRGTIYHNINNMWWIVINKFYYTNIASFYFFDLDCEENRFRKLVKKSGYHKPLSRLKFDAEETKQVQRQAKIIGKVGRIEKANEMLKFLYEIGWTSRWFSFELKPNSRLGLLEFESRAWGGHVVHEQPKKLTLYGRTLPMSSSESYWVKALRGYVVNCEKSITEWFCKDSNGEGSGAHYWPELRKMAWEIGVLAS